MSRRLTIVGDGELHLARCRRRRESAWVLAARFDNLDGVRGDQFVGCLRMTDSVTLRRLHHGYELDCVFDDHELVRPRLEQRLRELAPLGSAHFGWARFPDDGVTLEVLVERAREALPAEPAPERRRRRRVFRNSRAAEAK